MYTHMTGRELGESCPARCFTLLLTKDEARRIVVNIAKLAELLLERWVSSGFDLMAAGFQALRPGFLAKLLHDSDSDHLKTSAVLRHF